jgi:hypothetical protein
VRFSRGAGRVGARSSRSAPKGISPSLVFRNVFVSCARKISDGFTTKVAAFRVLALPLFAFATRTQPDPASGLPFRARSATRWSGIGSSAGCGKLSATLSIG